jgi:hypothetical protein
MNVDYTIHRYGEWVILLLGESVLSLLIVKFVPAQGYQQVFYCGVVSIALLQYLHFRSQPHHANEHAMRRSRTAGVAYAIILQVYSIALIVLGASFKMFLYEEVYGDETSGRRTVASILFRWLASTNESSASTSVSEEDKQQHAQNVAMFYCISLAIVWFCLDIMLLLHRGLKKHHSDINGCSWVRCAVVLLLILGRGALVLFMATFWLSESRATVLSFVGLWCVVLQLATREAGEYLFGEHVQHERSDEAADEGQRSDSLPGHGGVDDVCPPQ